MLVVVSGLPGVGKSAVAAKLAAHWSAVHLSIDAIEDAMLRAGLMHNWTTGVAAYEAARAAAEQNLALGHRVVVDAVNDSGAARDTWRQAAVSSGSALRFVLLLPPPPSEHRRRLQHRLRPLAHLPEPTWEQVTERAAAFTPWPDALTVDAAQPVETIVRQVIKQIDSR